MLDGCWFLHLSALHPDRNGQAQRSRSQRLARRHPDRAGRANHLSPFKAANLVFAAGLGLLALAATPLVLFAGWAVIGLGMGIGLYETGFATLAGIYGKDARGPIVSIRRRPPPSYIDQRRLGAAFGFLGFGAHFLARCSKLSRMRPISASSGSNFPPCHSSIRSCSSCLGSAMASRKSA